MLATKTTTKLPVGENRERAIVRFESQPCQPSTHHAYIVLAEMVRQIADQPGLLQCGPVASPDEIKFRHNGSRWVLEIQAEFAKVMTDGEQAQSSGQAGSRGNQ